MSDDIVNNSIDVLSCLTSNAQKTIRHDLLQTLLPCQPLQTRLNLVPDHGENVQFEAQLGTTMEVDFENAAGLGEIDQDIDVQALPDDTQVFFKKFEKNIHHFELY